MMLLHIMLYTYWTPMLLVTWNIYETQ